MCNSCSLACEAKHLAHDTSCRHAGAEVYISNLAKYKLLHKESKKYEGYRLTYLGYDFLAIHSLVKKGVINSVGRQIGVGKESDVFEVLANQSTDAKCRFVTCPANHLFAMLSCPDSTASLLPKPLA